MDELVPKVLSELGIPELASGEASNLVARLLGRVAATTTGTDEFPAVGNSRA
jgi:hypothetical protein